ncbi:MAG: DciA family protein [Micrococcaceae bacterium]
MSNDNLDARFVLYNRIKNSTKKRGIKKVAPKNYYYQLSPTTSRDPQEIGNLIENIITDRGWKESIDIGNVFENWENFVGKTNAQFTKVQSFEAGILTVKCDSTARATQLRLMQYDFISKINERLGKELVRTIKFIGPNAPSWRKGIRHVSGRGPRDTYG